MGKNPSELIIYRVFSNVGDMERDYDIIVAGGGMAGLITATTAAVVSKQNLKILVVDRNQPVQQGKKTISGWVCGDAVGSHGPEYFKKVTGIKYGKPEIEHVVKGVTAYAPDRQAPINFEEDGYMLNRRLMPQRMLKDAADLGIEFINGVLLQSVIAENGTVTGVKGVTKDGQPFKKTAKLVVDSTGQASMLRLNLPIDSFIQKKIDRNDLETTGRYIMEFEPGQEDKTFYDPDYCLIHLDNELAPGGYAWVFPKGEGKVNVGLGVNKRCHEERNEKMGKNDSLKELIDAYVKMNPALKNPKPSENPDDEGNQYGTWQVSVRRQNDCMTANGYMLVGDSAWMAKPLDAGGIGPAFFAGTMAGQTAVEAIEGNDVSVDSLWNYNIEFMKERGLHTPGMEVFRRMLQKLTNDQLNYGTAHFLSKVDLDKIMLGQHPEFSSVDKLEMAIKGAMNIKLAKELKYCAGKNKILGDLFENYPKSSKEFPEWHKKVMTQMHEAYERYPFKPFEQPAMA